MNTHALTRQPIITTHRIDEEAVRNINKRVPLQKSDPRDSIKRKLVIRKCIIFLVWDIFLSTILLNGICLGVLWSIQQLSTPLQTIPSLLILSSFWIVEWCIIVYLLIRWKNAYFTITPEKVIQSKGVFSCDQEVCAIKNVENLKLHQNIFGKIFRYGTIELYAPTLNHRIWIRNIHHPKARLHLVERLIPKTKKRNRNQEDMMILPSKS